MMRAVAPSWGVPQISREIATRAIGLRGNPAESLNRVLDQPHNSVAPLELSPAAPADRHGPLFGARGLAQSARLFGMRSRPQKPYTSSEDAKLRAMAKAGHSRNEIAAAMHRSSSSIYKRAKLLGIRLAVESPALHVTLRKLR